MSILPAHFAGHVHHFLSAGTVLLRMSPNWSVEASGNFTLPRDPAELAAVVVPEERVFVKSLYFLVNNEFMAIQCAARGGFPHATIIMRIYLIPLDVPGLRGRLRFREQKILTPARRQLYNVLSRISRNRNDWDGSEYASGSLSEPFLPPESDDRTIAELYSALDSPDATEVPIDLDALMINGRLRGMRTPLYPYQRRSVEAMLCKELRQSAIPNPLYIPLRGVDDTCMYLQPGTMELLRGQPLVVPNKGGILCEELGTGKTVMILALVIATLHQLPEQEESLDSEQQIHTPLSVRTFPCLEDARLRQLGRLSSPSPRIPYLRELLVHYCATTPRAPLSQPYQDVLPNPQLILAFEKNVPFYLRHPEDTSKISNNRSRRRQVEDQPREVYLSSATLIVVPPNLLNQWTNEILKHCEDRLRVFVLRDRAPLPRASKLAACYDIILMSHARFGAEDKKKNLTELYRRKPCKCPLIDAKIRVPNCQCPVHSNVSPLLQVRWKRLVVDEGHVSHRSNGNVTDFAKMLSVERRWLVTGTPTTNLMGLTFGNEEISEDQTPEEAQLENELVNSEPEPQLRYPDPDIDELPIISIPSMCHVWTSWDRGDLNKLGSMIGHFLKTAPFTSTPKLFSTHVTASLMDPAGPRSGSIQVLRQVMKMVMIRHQIEDVERDVVLPLRRHETILLDLEKYGVMTYNVLQAAILINAVTSERVGKDYMFHYKNQDYLQHTIENMSQATFWHIDQNLFNIEEINRLREEYREKAKDSVVISDNDCMLLDEAIDCDTFAFADNIWKALHQIQIPYIYHQVTGLPAEIYQAWSSLPATVSHLPHLATPTFLCSSDHLSQLQNIVLKHPLTSVSHMVQRGQTVKQAENLKLELHLADSVKKSKDGAKGNQTVLLKESLMNDPGKMKQIHGELLQTQENIKVFTGQGSTVPSQLREDQDSRSALLASSPLVGTWIWNSTSSKLNYILQDVMSYAHGEKFLIFSHSLMTLAYISESLELFQIKHLRFTSMVPLSQREQYVTTFETSDTYRVFLMELRHGARGLNLISANRVIFCEPVWKPDDEAQAIKRVHRIGQVKPVTVKTLVARSTFEEFMLSHRHTSPVGSEKTGIAKDKTMRDFIANPRFLPMPPNDAPSANSPLKFPLLGHASQRRNARNPTSPSSALKATILSHSERERERAGDRESTNKPRAVQFAV